MEKRQNGEKAPHHIPTLQERLSGKVSSCSTIFNSQSITRASLVVSGTNRDGSGFCEIMLIAGEDGLPDMKTQIKDFAQAIGDKFYAAKLHPSTQGK